MKKKSAVTLINNIIEPTIVDIRNNLARKYNIFSEEYKDFAGLCYVASAQCKERLESIIFDEYGLKVVVDTIHGEQRHSPRIPSNKWAIQHTWVVMNILDHKIYIDATSSQFKDIYNDIPSYYISENKPKWYYPDRSNPVWNGITKRINQKIQIKRKINNGTQTFIIDEGLIEFIQFEIWGNISDLIRRIFI